MRRTAALLALTVASVVSACGQYTNFPARVKIAGESNLVGEVTYTFSGTGTAANATATVKNPKLVLQGEPGSVGVTFDTMRIDYKGADSLQTKTVNLNIGLRVDSSHTVVTKFDNGSTNPPNKIVPTELKIGKGQLDLPVVSADVVRLGNPASPNGNFISSPITAVVTMSGIDDAGWPSELQFGVPINFVRPGN
jgi:hypothetical protein